MLTCDGYKKAYIIWVTTWFFSRQCKHMTAIKRPTEYMLLHILFSILPIFEIWKCIIKNIKLKKGSKFKNYSTLTGTYMLLFIHFFLNLPPFLRKTSTKSVLVYVVCNDIKRGSECLQFSASQGRIWLNTKVRVVPYLLLVLGGQPVRL